MTNVIHVNFKSLTTEQDAAITRREERKRLGRERMEKSTMLHRQVDEAAKALSEHKADVRWALSEIARIDGAPAMLQWVEQECLAAWKVRECSNE